MLNLRLLILVSIRASLQQRGEHDVARVISIHPVFQSAPHFSSEANLKNYFERLKIVVVSIRASLQQRGERQRA